MATVLVQACLEADFNAETGTCAAPIWIPQPSMIPALTIADAQQISGAIALLFAVAFVFRLLRKFLNQA